MGENGLFNRARFAKEKYLNEESYTEKQISELANQIDSNIKSGSREQVTVDKEEYEGLKATVSSLQTNMTNMQTELNDKETRIAALESISNNNNVVIKASKTKSVGSSWATLENISLNNYGHGKAVISLYVTTGNTYTSRTSARICINDNECAVDRCNAFSSSRRYMEYGNMFNSNKL